MELIRNIKRKVMRVTKALVIKANYLFGNYNEVIWLIGDGRSGTTWVSDLINHDKTYREMFEPFHPKLIPDMGFIVPHQYIRPDDFNGRVEALSSDIFTGKYTHKRIDSKRNSLVLSGLLIKDIFANLLCYPASLKFPKIKPVLLIRNPFAVALSKQKKEGWYWVTQPLDLLNQKDLYEDHLIPFENLIRETSAKNNFILNQVLIWSIINYIPLRQFEPGHIHVCFYENIYTDPRSEISKIFKFVRDLKVLPEIKLNKEIINRPSRASGVESSLLSGRDPISAWKGELEPELVQQGLKILACFGFEKLYDDNSMPNMDALLKSQGWHDEGESGAIT